MENQNPHFTNVDQKDQFNKNPFPQQQNDKHLIHLPKAIGVLITGIATFPAGIGAYGIPGVIVAIVALSMAKTAMDAYRENPSIYKESSLKLVQNGRLCAVIGLVVSVLATFGYIWYFSEFGSAWSRIF